MVQEDLDWPNKELSTENIYVISEVSPKPGTYYNPIHEEVLDCLAYILKVECGERGYLKYRPTYGDVYHALHTSTVLSCSAHGNGEPEVQIETANTIYILRKSCE